MGPNDYFHCGHGKETTAEIQYTLSMTVISGTTLCFEILDIRLLMNNNTGQQLVFTLFSKPVEITPVANMQAYS